MPVQESPGGNVNPDAPIPLRLDARNVVDILPRLRDIIQELLSDNGISTEPLQYTPFIGEGTDADQPILIVRLQEPVQGTVWAWWVLWQRALRFEIHDLLGNFQAPHTTLVPVPHQTSPGAPWEPSQLTRSAQARSLLSNIELDWEPGKERERLLAAREGSGMLITGSPPWRLGTPIPEANPTPAGSPSWRWAVPIPEAGPTSETDPTSEIDLPLDIRSMVEEVMCDVPETARIATPATEEPAQTPILPELVKDEYTGKPFRVIEIDDE